MNDLSIQLFNVIFILIKVAANTRLVDTKMKFLIDGFTQFWSMHLKTASALYCYLHEKPFQVWSLQWTLLIICMQILFTIFVNHALHFMPENK